MNCPQCGTGGFEAGKECRTCGFYAEQADENSMATVPMIDSRRDVMNGIGLGCSALAMIWFFVETLVFFFASRNPHTWSTYGPLVEVSVPIMLVTVFYLILSRNKSNFSKGVGYSLLITLVLALVFGIVLSKSDNKPPANGSHSEGF
jgi:Ca2+/Na+ antiporter